jgi:hypothetical protein
VGRGGTEASTCGRRGARGQESRGVSKRTNGCTAGNAGGARGR